jgi:hypothetical protein
MEYVEHNVLGHYGRTAIWIVVFRQRVEVEYSQSPATEGLNA